MSVIQVLCNVIMTLSDITSYANILLLSMMGKIFSGRHVEIIFFIFPRKQVLTFHANCL